MTCRICPTPCGPALAQPYGVEAEADGVFVKQMVVPHAQTIVPQHAHAYAHLTMLAKGSMEVWAEAAFLGRFQAPAPIYIEANVKHSFLTLEDDTIAYCIHRTDRTGAIEIAELNSLEGV